MKKNNKSTKKIIMIISSVIALSIIVVVVLLFMGYPIFNVQITGRDPFWAAFEEYDAVIKSIFEPIYPDMGPTGIKPNSVTIVQYFLDNDFTEEFSSLGEIYQKAIQGDKDSRDQRQKTKNIRADAIRRIRESLENIHAAMELIQKYTDKNEWIFTSEEDMQLFEFMWPVRHLMFSKNRW